MNQELKKDLDQSDHGLIKALAQHLPVQAENLQIIPIMSMTHINLLKPHASKKIVSMLCSQYMFRCILVSSSVLPHLFQQGAMWHVYKFY
jgi:hypothetical protein